MTYLSAVLLLSSAAVLSVILLKSSADRTKSAREAYEFASFLEERIRLTRTPIDDAAAAFDGGVRILASLMNDAYASRLISSIGLSTPESAAANAVLLKNHTEKEMLRIAEEETKRRKAKAFLPALLALLVIILFL